MLEHPDQAGVAVWEVCGTFSGWTFAEVLQPDTTSRLHMQCDQLPPEPSLECGTTPLVTVSQNEPFLPYAAARHTLSQQ